MIFAFLFHGMLTSEYIYHYHESGYKHKNISHFPLSNGIDDEKTCRKRKTIVHVDLTADFPLGELRVGFVLDLRSEVISDVTGVVADFVLDHQRDVGGHGQRHLRRKRSRFAEKVEVTQSES